MSNFESDDERNCVDDLQEIKKYVDKQKTTDNRMFVSGWDDDYDDIEEIDPNVNSNSKMLWAAENGEIDVVKRLVTEDRNVLKAVDPDGYSPLHRASYNNHVSIVEYLLSVGANHAATTKDKWQPLHSACHWNNTLCAIRLLEGGADVNSVTAGGQTPLHLAASHSTSKDTLEMLLFHPLVQTEVKNNAGETPFDIARRSGPYSRLFEVFEPCMAVFPESQT